MRPRAPKNGLYRDNSFNPRICKRCDEIVTPFDACDEVSIHASVKDATQGQ